MKIHLTIEINKPKWWFKLFPCRHEIGHFEEEHGRYESYGSYMLCKKCGREAMDIERNCRHKEDTFGVCIYCRQRLSKFDCSHNWLKEPDTDELFCDDCGEWAVDK